MRRLLAGLIAICSMFLAAPVYAANGVQWTDNTQAPGQVQGCDGSTRDSAICADQKNTANPLFGPTGILTKVAGVFGLLTGVIATFMIILSGARYVMSGGDPGKTATAKNGILYSAIGIGVSLVAGVLVRYVLTKL